MSYLAELFRQIKRSVAEPHMEISFWFGKGDIPNEKIRLPPLEVHFGVRGCDRTDSEGWMIQDKMKGWVYSRPPPLTLPIVYALYSCARKPVKIESI